MPDEEQSSAPIEMAMDAAPRRAAPVRAEIEEAVAEAPKAADPEQVIIQEATKIVDSYEQILQDVVGFVKNRPDPAAGIDAWMAQRKAELGL